MKKAAPLHIFTLLFLALARPSIAQQEKPDSLITNELQPVTITAYRLETKDISTPLSITRIGEKLLQTGMQQLALDEALTNVPGVFVQNGTNFAQDIRISIRGFGARSAFGIRGVKILVDGFPESTPDGTAQVDAVDPGSLTGLSVIRSGTGGLYGNASGGYVNFTTTKFQEKAWGEMSSMIGSYGFHRSQIRMGGSKGKKFLYSLNGSTIATDGYRDHSAMRNSLLNGGFLMPIDSSLSIRGVVTYANSPQAQDPGGINEEQVEDDRKSANNSAERYDAGEKLWQLRLGIGLTKTFSKQHTFKTSFFQTNRSFSSKLINDMVKLERSFTGGSFSYAFKTKHRNINWNITTGIDLENQIDDRKRFQNDNGEQGDQYNYQTESFGAIGVFIIQKLDLGRHFSFLPAIRYDAVKIGVNDKSPNSLPENDLNDNYQSLNPSIGFSMMLVPGFHIFTNFGRNFETPTLLEISQSLNMRLKPQKSKSLEIGYKIDIAGGKMRLEPTIFRIKLKDEIVYTQDSPSNLLYDNVGKSTRIGLEVILAGQLSKRIYANINYTYSDFETIENGVYGRSKTPGIPNHMAGMMVQFSGNKGMTITYGNNVIGYIPIDYDSGIRTSPYVNGYLRASHKFHFNAFNMELSGGINNLYNKKYNTNIRINSNRPYEPAPSLNYYFGLKIMF